MANQQLIDYIRENFKLGRDKEIIKSLLINTGWQKKDIEEAFNDIAGNIEFKDTNKNYLPYNSISVQKPQLPKSLFGLVISIVGTIISGLITFFLFYNFIKFSFPVGNRKLLDTTFVIIFVSFFITFILFLISLFGNKISLSGDKKINRSRLLFFAVFAFLLSILILLFGFISNMRM